jgi:hypothetical protein
MSDEEGRPLISVGPAITLGVLILAGVAGALGGPPLVLIFLSACTLSLTIFLVWNSLAKMGDGARLEFEDALELAAPTATEEQKLSVLRALKDLEYELSVGKISKEDFDVASSEYRAEARKLIAAQDESMKAQIEAAETVISKHLAQASSRKKSKKPDLKSEDEAGQSTSETAAL